MDRQKSENSSYPKMKEKDRRIKELEEDNTKLKKELEKIRKECEDTKREYEETKKEFEEFKSKHAITVSNLRRALNIKSDGKKTFKSLGAPKGHKGYTRKIPERIDRVKALNPKICNICKTKLGKTQEIRSRCVTDIALTSEVINTRYDIHRKYCPKCGKIVEPEVPNVLPHARFGLNLMLLVMYLKIGLRLPGNKIKDFLLTIYNLTISDGEISHILKQLSREFGDYYVWLEKVVKLARVKHTDSTSWRINGKNYFAWVFIAFGVVIYKICKRNNSRVPLSVFGTKQKGNVLTIDRHSALRALAQKAGFILQYCWSHITDDSKKLSESFGAEGKYVHRKLKEIYAKAKSFEHNGTSEIVEQLKGEIFELTQRHYKHLTVWKFVQTLANRDIDSLFIFVVDKEVDSTNNISERELRELVLMRDISHGSKSHRGANATAMLLSVIQTLRLNKVNVLRGLRNIVNNPSGY